MGRLGLVGVEKTRNVDAAIPFIKILNRIAAPANIRPLAFGPDILLLQASFEAPSSQRGSPHRHDSLAVAASLGRYQGPVWVPREQQSGIDVWSSVVTSLSDMNSTAQWLVRDTLSFLHAASPLVIITFICSETRLREMCWEVTCQG